ncbi:hypothetical protein FJTKL_14592 [Diaporthe vaccinii]|uniref:Uncharacterized protein n=1 Tax=Diaporthe vaccinii TaxID=105482 RepID=A0ABR4E6U9_9PEZI
MVRLSSRGWHGKSPSFSAAVRVGSAGVLRFLLIYPLPRGGVRWYHPPQAEPFLIGGWWPRRFGSCPSPTPYQTVVIEETEE